MGIRGGCKYTDEQTDKTKGLTETSTPMLLMLMQVQ